MANFERWGITDGFRLARTVGKELNNPSNYSPEEFIEAAKRALKKHPNEWVIYYALADKYHQLGHYAEALKTTEKCVKIRPNDIRSACLLATSYNLLTRAAWTDEEEETAKKEDMMMGGQDTIDKKLSQKALNELGFTLEKAVLQAQRWFEKALTLNPNRESRAGIELILQILHNRFPHIVT